MLVTRTKDMSLWACIGTKKFVYYFETERRRLAKTLKMEKFKLLKYSILVGHVYLQHEGLTEKETMH